MSNATTNKPARQCHLQWVKADVLNVNPVAQREFIPSWGQWLLDNFDIDKMQMPHVNRRKDGSLFIMEGQHTVWAYRQWVGEGQQIQVWLYEGLSEPEEAEQFISLNHKKGIQALPQFRASVTAGRKTECDIDRIVRANGCSVSKSKGDDCISAVTTLVTIYERFGGPVLGRTIRVIRASFVDGGYERPVLLGIAQVLARYAGEIDEDHLVKKLSGIRNGWKGLVQRTANLKAAHGVSQTEAAAAAVVEFYNAGRGGVKLMTWWAGAA